MIDFDDKTFGFFMVGVKGKVRHRILHRRRCGLTLVELLVVVGVVSVLAAVVLPSVKTVLTDRKSSQAAIVVRNFIEAARARAIGKNRAVAVVFERLSSRATVGTNGTYISETATPSPIDPLNPSTNFVPYNACIRLSLAEEPMPITEAMLPAQVTITAREPRDGLNPPIPNPGGYLGQDEMLDDDQQDSNGNIIGPMEVRIFRVASASNIDLTRVIGESLVNGAEISFGNSNRRFTIVSPYSPNSHRQHASAGDGSIWFSVMNEKGFEGRGERALEPYEEINPGTVFTTFKIYGKPKPVFSEMVQLPRGMCIDLSLSGFGGTRRGASSIPPVNQPVNNPLGAKDDLTDYRVRFASDWIGNEMRPLAPEQLRPVYVVFSKEGQLSHVWANNRRIAGDTNYTGTLTRIDAVQDIFLHIGKIDQITMPGGSPVPPGTDPFQFIGRSTTSFVAERAAGVKTNVTDLNNYVVRLSPKSGAIISAPAVNIDTQMSILGLSIDALNFGDLVELSRRGTYNSNVTSQ